MVALAKATHLLGLGVWIGVLVVTLVVNAGSGRTSAALGSWSRVAITGAVVTVASGFVLAGRMVVSITGLFATAFGQLLALKLLGIAVAVVAGLAHRRFRRRAARRRRGRCTDRCGAARRVDGNLGPGRR